MRRRPASPPLEPTRHPGWGGRRAGAGRKPKGRRALVSHMTRPALTTRFPVHVTARVLPRVWDLGSKRALDVIGAALAAGGERAGLRVCAFSVQGRHMHFIVEAADAVALSRGMQGLSIRIARGLNRMMGTAGKVFADRFESRILRTPADVANAIASVRDDHADPGAPSSAPGSHGVVLPVARSGLLRRALG